MNDYYVYAHMAEDNKVFYIGKGRGIRQYQTGNRNQYWKRTTSKYNYISILLEEGLSEKEAYNKEIKWIKYYKGLGECSTNFTDGGDGVRVAQRWWGAAQSKALKGQTRPRGKASKAYKDIISKETLIHLYINQGLSSIKIGKQCGLSSTTINTRLQEYRIPTRRCGQPRVRIRCTSDGQEFQSIKDAARYYHVFRENIRKVLHGKYKHTGGKSFIYVTNNR